MLINPAAQCRGWKRARDARHLFAVIDQNEGGDATNAKAPRQVRRVIAVDLDELEPSGQLGRDLFDDGRHDAAGAAPGRPEIPHDRQRALLDDRRKVSLAAFRQPRQGGAAVATMRDAGGRRPHAVHLAAVRAAHDCGFVDDGVHRLVMFSVRNFSRGTAVTKTAAAPSYGGSKAPPRPTRLTSTPRKRAVSTN